MSPKQIPGMSPGTKTELQGKYINSDSKDAVIIFLWNMNILLAFESPLSHMTEIMLSGHSCQKSLIMIKAIMNFIVS